MIGAQRKITSSHLQRLAVVYLRQSTPAQVRVNVRSTELGLSLVRALPASDQVRRADDAASRGFAPGIVSPTEVDVLAPGVA